MTRIARIYKELKKVREMPAAHKYFVRISYNKIKKRAMSEMWKNMVVTKLVEKLLQPVPIDLPQCINVHLISSVYPNY